MLETLILSFWEYAQEAGTWAVICFITNAFWISAGSWLIIRLRKEAKEQYDILSGIIAKKEANLQKEKDDRREEALKLQAAGYESLSELVKLMERNETALGKLDTSMLNCIRFQDMVSRMNKGE